MRTHAEQLTGVCMALVCAGFALSLAAGSAASHTPLPTPMPSARDCYYFKRLYAVTAESFDRHHLSASQRRFIMKYVMKIPTIERRFAKWTFDADVDEGLLIYDALPTNVAFDPVECRPIITPSAMQGQVRVGNSRI